MGRPVPTLNTANNGKWLRAAIGCALGSVIGAALVLGATPARAEDDRAPDVKILDSIMGAFGLVREGSPGSSIDYRERSPLVIPPNTALPPPQSADIKDPNWPVDPEVRRERALNKAAYDDGLTSSQRMDQNSRPLPLSELEKGRTAKKQPNSGSTSDGIGNRSTFSELGYKGGIFGTMFSSKKDEVARFTGEAPRASLIDPPTGYQTPSASQPYGLSKDKGPIKPTDSYTEHGMNIGK
jgi:hypothetical protein